MNNLLRTLVWDGQVSLTVADTTDIVKKAVALHGLSVASATVLGKTLSAMTFMSACLKEETGEISLSVKCDGIGGEIGVSGNKKLFLRGYIENTQAQAEQGKEESTLLGENGSITVIRDDGYSRPFVGACAFPQTVSVDAAFEEYFRISEQLPTRIATVVKFDENGTLVFSGVAVLQPLPFADEQTLQKTWNISLNEVLSAVQKQGIEESVKAYFVIDKSVWEWRNAQYKCNCSRQYLTRVLVSLGEAQMRHIIKEDGAVRVHCHYCNTDYEFTDTDADRIFPKE